MEKLGRSGEGTGQRPPQTRVLTDQAVYVRAADPIDGKDARTIGSGG
jgi:hypothetical protein